MAANISDLITKTFDTVNPNVALVTSNRVIGGTEIQADNLAGWSEDTAMHFMTYQLDSEGEVIEGSQTDWKGIVNKASNKITNIVRVAGAVDSGSFINDVVMAGPTASWSNDLATGLLEAHNPDGTLKLDAAMVQALSDAITPVATRREYAGTEAQFDADPAAAGWLFMLKGRDYSKATYQRLYDHLVVANSDFVKDDSGTTFKFADSWFGTVPVSVDADQPEFDTLGKSGGQKTLQEHTHDVGAIHDNRRVANGSSIGNVYAIFDYSGENTRPSAPAGSGVNNMNPYLAVNRIIKF